LPNIIAIVGRPNVGKSTLFNRLIEKKKAIMDNVSGVTRDRHYGSAQWAGRHFTVIDTGGYVSGSDDIFESEIRKQVELAIEESSVILFMVDASEGITPLDEEFANYLRKTSRPVVIIANKADNHKLILAANEFYALGLEGEVFPVSSVSGSGTGELLDKAISYLREDPSEEREDIPRLAILGRPNAGKSSFLNVLLGTDRSIVTDIPGTTRDSIDTRYDLFGKDFIITDTAGIRKRSRVKDDIEFYSVMRSLRSLEDCDVCMVMVDATRGFESQDMNLIALADRNKKGVLIMVNKWDLVEKDSKTAREYEKKIKNKIAPFDYVPIFFTSVTEKKRIFQSIEMAVKIFENRKQKISTSKLNNTLLPLIEKQPPPAVKGKYIRIKYITQLPSRTPVFAFFCNLPQYIKPAYERFLIKTIRQHYDFTGVPVKVVFRKK